MGLAFLPELLPSPFAGLLLSVCLYAVGGGIIEVLVSPIVEACPGDKKEQAMSLLHSFYCWGYLLVVLLSTLFFYWAGIQNWRLLACLWALIPLANAVYFTRVPIKKLVEEDAGLGTKQLFSMKAFWTFLFLMACAGAAENSMSQWSSAFAELGLNLPKAVGDLTGPCLFAICMGCTRVFYARFGDRIPLKKFMALSGALCVLSYVLAALSPWPALALAGCALCGVSVGILWPGTFSLASKAIPTGGTVMFGMMALGGDLGCSIGPTLVGFVSGLFGGRLQAGILAAIFFPVLLLVLLGGVPRAKKDVHPHK